MTARLAPSPDLDDVAAIARRLIGAPVREVSLAAVGGNNRIFRIDSGDRSFALKFYAAHEHRDRLGAESAALRFLNGCGLRSVPRALAMDRTQGCGLYEWIEGTRISVADESDIDALADFALALQAFRANPGAESIGPASAATLSLGDAVRQIEERLAPLHSAAAHATELRAFLDGEFAPLKGAVTERALRDMEANGIAPDAVLPKSRQALSPSDFGLHNVLRRADGRLAFIDFEYFGWDDPVKMVADMLLHPGHDLAPGLRQRFLNQTAPYFARKDDGFRTRFRIAFPVFGLIWCLIILGGFAPGRSAPAGLDVHEQSAARARQLDKARRLAAEIRNAEAQHGSAPLKGVEI